MKEYFTNNKNLIEDPSVFKPKKVYDKTSCQMWFDPEGIFHKQDGALRGYYDPRDSRFFDKLR